MRGWETKGEDFNVCLPREAIKINTSNYQAVLNFLGATSAVRRLSPTHPATSRLQPPNPPSAPILVKFFLHRTTRRISLHSRAFTSGGSCNYARWGAFVNVKGENPPLKVHDEGLRRFHVLMISLRGKNSSELFIIEPRRTCASARARVSE